MFFVEKYVDSTKYSSHTLQNEHHESKSLKLYNSSKKSPPYSSQLFPVIGDQSLYFQPFEHIIVTSSLTAYE